jgi:hypothetical protein
MTRIENAKDLRSRPPTCCDVFMDIYQILLKDSLTTNICCEFDQVLLNVHGLRQQSISAT